LSNVNYTIVYEPVADSHWNMIVITATRRVSIGHIRKHPGLFFAPWEWRLRFDLSFSYLLDNCNFTGLVRTLSDAQAAAEASFDALAHDAEWK